MPHPPNLAPLDRTFRLAAVSIALLLAACARPSPSPLTESPTAPPTFLEAEPPSDAPSPDHLSLAIVDGLALVLHAKPLLLTTGGWGFELELEFHNQLRKTGVFNVGVDPIVVFNISVTLPDGSGFGSGGGCTLGSRHGPPEHAIGPGERFDTRQTWTAGVEAGQVLEAAIHLCDIERPDKSGITGTFAWLDVVVDERGRISKFGLRADE